MLLFLIILQKSALVVQTNFFFQIFILSDEKNCNFLFFCFKCQKYRSASLFHSLLPLRKTRHLQKSGEIQFGYPTLLNRLFALDAILI